MNSLTEEDFRVIQQMRLERKQTEEGKKEKPIKQKIVYYVKQPRSGVAEIEVADQQRKITNSIFSVSFQRKSSTGNNLSDIAYEAFMIDSNGQIISDIYPINTIDINTGDGCTVRFTLGSQGEYNKTDQYYLVLRDPVMSEQEVVSMTPYAIELDFAPDFDF